MITLPRFRKATVARRFAALILDYLVLTGISAVLTLEFLVLSNPSNPRGGVALTAALVLGFAATIAFALVGYAYGWTLGKLLLGIRFVNSGGDSGVGLGLMREFVAKNLVFGLLGAVSFGGLWLLDDLWALWDKDNQALHDKLAGTFVVLKA